MAAARVHRLLFLRYQSIYSTPRVIGKSWITRCAAPRLSPRLPRTTSCSRRQFLKSAILPQVSSHVGAHARSFTRSCCRIFSLVCIQACLSHEICVIALDVRHWTGSQTWYLCVRMPEFVSTYVGSLSHVHASGFLKIRSLSGHITT